MATSWQRLTNPLRRVFAGNITACGSVLIALLLSTSATQAAGSVSPWSYAIFTNGDMELHNGFPMTITGAVHSNGNIYTGCGGQMTFSGTVDAVGTINVGKSPSDTNHGTPTVTPNGPGWPMSYLNDNLSKPNPSLKITPNGVPDSEFSRLDANPNNDDYHEMVERPVFPLTVYPDPLSPGDTRTDASQPSDCDHLSTARYYNKADYIITIDNATHDIRLPADKASVTITDAAGNTYTVAKNPNTYNAFLNGLTANGTTLKPILGLPSLTVNAAADAGNTATGSAYFKDFREGEKDNNADTAVFSDKYVPTVMQMTNVDVAALKAAADAGIIKTGGITIYIQDIRSVAPLVGRMTHTVVTSSTNAKGKVTTTTSTVVDSNTMPKTAPAIRLKNGATLPSGGLTVVSPNPVYVQGDYNTGASYDPTTGALLKQPAAATAASTGWPDTGSYWDALKNALPLRGSDPAFLSAHDPTTLTQSDSGASASSVVDFRDPHTSITGKYYWQPAAIVADAINVLSNAWTDTNSGRVPNAWATVINAAFIAGNVSAPTTAATIAQTGYPTTAYSGGIESFPRLLENWTSVKFCYVGSMSILFESQQSTGVWGKSNVYMAPTRRWAHDKNFLTHSPPGSMDMHPSLWIPSPPKATLNAGNKISLSVLGDSYYGESTVRYTWTASGTNQVVFDRNGTNAAKSVTASVAKSGTYNFLVTIADNHSAPACSSVSSSVDNSLFTLWQQQYFNATEIADPTVSGPLADPNHDGICNLIDYAFGRVPNTSGTVPIMIQGTETIGSSTYLTFTYHRLKNPSDVTYLECYSSNQVNWVEGCGSVIESVTDDNNGQTETVTTRLGPSVTVSPTQYFRIAVTQQGVPIQYTATMNPAKSVPAAPRWAIGIMFILLIAFVNAHVAYARRKVTRIQISTGATRLI